MSTFGKYCNDFEQISGDSEGQGSLACCGLWICKESDTTQQLNSNMNCVFSVFHIYLCVYRIKLYIELSLFQSYYNHSVGILRVLDLGFPLTCEYQNPDTQVPYIKWHTSLSLTDYYLHISCKNTQVVLKLKLPEGMRTLLSRFYLALLIQSTHHVNRDLNSSTLGPTPCSYVVYCTWFVERILYLYYMV